MHHNEHFSWFRSDFTVVILPSSDWSDHFFLIRRGQGCNYKCINHSSKHPCKFLLWSLLSHSYFAIREVLDFLFYSFYTTIIHLMFAWELHCLIWKGVKLVFRTEELEEKQSKRFCNYLPYLFWSSIVCSIAFYCYVYNSSKKMTSAVGYGMRPGYQVFSSGHATTSFLWNNLSTWRWQLLWQG